MGTEAVGELRGGRASDPVAGRARIAHAVVLVQYLALVVSAPFWVRLSLVRYRVPDLRVFYAFLGVIALYLCVRAYLVLVRRIPERWGPVWPIADVVIVSVLVRITGGLNSVAPFLYLFPLALCSIQHRPYEALAAGVLGGVLYLAVTWFPDRPPAYWVVVGPRVAALAMVTALAVTNAAAEAARVRDVVAMREQLALADYRQRLSQEMHDGIQHYLVGLTVRLELARQLMADDPREAARIAVDQRYLARQAADELRALVRLLRAPVMDRESFVDALRQQLSVFGERCRISAPLQIEGSDVALPPEVSHTAFRIVQEALTNAEKHAQASKVGVTLRFGPEAFELTVKDDGIGFDVASAAQQSPIGSGFGLRGMRQRADSVGGWLRVESRTGEGTEIAFGVPLSPQPSGRPARSRPSR